MEGLNTHASVYHLRDNYFVAHFEKNFKLNSLTVMHPLSNNS